MLMAEILYLLDFDKPRPSEKAGAYLSKTSI